MHHGAFNLTQLKTKWRVESNLTWPLVFESNWHKLFLFFSSSNGDELQVRQNLTTRYIFGKSLVLIHTLNFTQPGSHPLQYGHCVWFSPVWPLPFFFFFSISDF